MFCKKSIVKINEFTHCGKRNVLVHSNVHHSPSLSPEPILSNRNFNSCPGGKNAQSDNLQKIFGI